MQRDDAWARARFRTARVARLATVSVNGLPHVVPIVFAVVGDQIVTAVDQKPKKTTKLRRLTNIAANPRVSVLVDEYDEDWSQLWWARADGLARVVGTHNLHALVARYEQYVDEPPDGPAILVDVERWSGWSATE